MRLYELAYCCRIYIGLDAYDKATLDLRAATGPAVDPNNPDHVAPLFQLAAPVGLSSVQEG